MNSTSDFIILIKNAMFAITLIIGLSVQTNANDLCDFSDSADGSPVWSPTGDTIAFVSDCAGSFDIWLVDPDGENLRNVTAHNHGNGYEHAPDWSPDGSSLAYVAADDLYARTSDIWIINVDDGLSFNLTARSEQLIGRGNARPIWSSDGNYLVFESVEWIYISDIWLYDFQDDTFSNLTPDNDSFPDSQMSFCFPNWSWDSKKIVVTECTLLGDDGVWEIEIATGLPWKLTNQEGFDARWSPDGEILMFYSLPGIESGDIFLLEKTHEGVEITSLARGGRPRWSPDGGRIAFMDIEMAGDNIDILVMDQDGSHPANLTSGNGQHNRWPEWSPDGEYLVFESDRDGTYDIWLVELDTLRFEKLVG